MINIFSKNNKGFTLIELMTSVAIFSVVATVAISSILIMLNDNQKARALSSGVNGMIVVLDGMTSTIKEGKNLQTAGSPSSCNFTIDSFPPFYDFESESLDDEDRKTIEFRFTEEAGVGRIERKIGVGNFGGFSSIQVDIDAFVCYLVNNGPNEHPAIILSISGKTLDKDAVQFDLQTAISPRYVTYP